MTNAALAVQNPRKFVASTYQQNFFNWVERGKGSAILKAVAGSGKSTSIVRALPYIEPRATVLILAFNAPIAKEMKAKIEALDAELGRSFANVEASTFHARGWRALLKKWGRNVHVPAPDGGKIRKILKDRLSEDEYEMYGDFVAKLVGYAKGVGVGIPGLATDEVQTWENIIATQEMWLDDEDATEERAIDIAQKALRASNRKAETEKWVDFDDQLYLPLLWNLRLFRHDWVFVDEAQDTNPVRREFAKRSLRFDAKYPGRLVAVGDPKQSIYAFTGASTDAMDQIADEFNTIELPLTVSYRCPKAALDQVRHIVPYFEVHESAIEGKVETLKAKDALKLVGPEDAVLCRKTAPLISLAFSLIAEGRGCRVVGKDIGGGLVSLIKKLRPKGVDGLVERLDAYFENEQKKLAKNGEDAKIEALNDRIQCIRTVIDSTPERTVPKVIERIESLFADGDAKVLSLMTGHKAKGREYRRVIIWMPELLPIKSAKSDEAYQQEMNLDYVMRTRFTEEMYLVPGEVRA